MLKVYHPDAVAQYSVKNDLVWIATELFDEKLRTGQPKISVGSSFTPMLSKRSNISMVERQMKNQPYWIETKLVRDFIFISRTGKECCCINKEIRTSGIRGKRPIILICTALL